MEEAARIFGQRPIAAETKYDGERMQIHIRRTGNGGTGSDIRIFSKNARDSTYERACVHAAILAGLGLDPASAPSADARNPIHGKHVRYPTIISESVDRVRNAVATERLQHPELMHKPTIEQDLIVEAEMVAWDAGSNRGTGCIASFYTLEQIKASLGGPW